MTYRLGKHWLNGGLFLINETDRKVPFIEQMFEEPRGWSDAATVSWLGERGWESISALRSAMYLVNDHPRFFTFKDQTYFWFVNEYDVRVIRNIRKPEGVLAPVFFEGEEEDVVQTL